MKIKKTMIVHASVDALWNILGDQYASVGDWTRAINASQKISGKTLKGAPAYGRVCDTSGGVFKEKITQYDEERYILAYQVEEGMPFFVKQGGNTWTLSSLGSQKTQVDMEMLFVIPKVMEWMMGWMMKKQMTQTADIFLDDLKRYAETGQVSAQKLSILQQAKA